MDMFCRNCGFKFDNDGDKFCPRCGAAREAKAAEAGCAPDKNAQPEREPAPATQPAPAPSPQQGTPPAAPAAADAREKPDTWRVWVYVVATYVWAFTQEAVIGWGSAALLLWDNILVNKYLAPESISYFWSIFVGPLYLWRRGTELHEGRGLFWLGLIGMGVGLYIMLATAPLRILYNM